MLDELHKRTPSVRKYLNYFEIFLGGGALFFSLEQNRSKGSIYLSDSNSELINAYEVVRDDVENLIQHLKQHKNTQEYYRQIREWDRSPRYPFRSKLARASRFIYLNKTAYNGLYRVNSRGEFNVPYGRYKNPKFVDSKNLRICSTVLQDVNIEVLDFEENKARISRSDFVYLDPPYEPVTPTASFTAYTSTKFDETQQIRLFKFCQEIHRKGAYFMLSNSCAPWIAALYSKEKDFHVGRVMATRAVNCKADRRGAVKEIIVRNYS